MTFSNEICVFKRFEGVDRLTGGVKGGIWTLMMRRAPSKTVLHFIGVSHDHISSECRTHWLSSGMKKSSQSVWDL